jgi:glycine C-acetyltransferase
MTSTAVLAMRTSTRADQVMTEPVLNFCANNYLGLANHPRVVAAARAAMAQACFRVPAGEHPIVPVMLGDALVATCMAARLLDLGVYVTGFSYPVVPQGAARIRVQLSAAHTPEQVDRAVEAFAAAAREEGKGTS